ncbi:chromosome partitioning protein [Pseudarcicella hirudinis]|uniref:Chromosome partitioning protein n=1 Tax=Pseudarcicella hirudinis TaxID=1079859 RepID=A0A1I5TMS5_9BACT|nr:ParA family protein [Pseudarcicella hirudinis]SFP84394.1 chromosome partitioning protein [Pseudarcicella hirudinis]
MLNHEKAISFLRRNPALSISVLEKEAGLPNSTLAKSLNGDRVLNAKHLSALYPILTKYGYNESINQKARIISIINHKGGVGKTTTTINLGKALTSFGFKVLLVDMDSQGNLSQSLGVDNPDKQVVHALLKNVELPITPIEPNYDLAPSDLELAYADLELVQAVGGVNQLKNKLNAFREKYDFILIDCPPALNIFTNSALVASTSCLVTLQPEVSAMKGINNLFERITQVRERINPDLGVEGIVLTMVDKRLKIHRDMIDYVYQNLGNFKIFKTEIRINVALKESQIAQMDIFRYDSHSNGAVDYLSLAREFCTNN